jgi:hypothetical protein
VSASLVITPNLGDTAVTIVEQARVQRDELLHQAVLVTTITDRIDADDALTVAKSLKAYVDTIESQRTAAKAPVLELSRKIDGLAKELTSDASKQYDRISRALGTFEAEERRKAEDARRAAEAEAARIKAEAEKAALAARRAAKSAEAADRAADAVVEKAQAQIVEVRQTAINTAAPKAEGTKLAGTIMIAVDDINALYADSPNLCTVSANEKAIKAIIKANPNIQLPGVRHWIDHKLNV